VALDLMMRMNAAVPAEEAHAEPAPAAMQLPESPQRGALATEMFPADLLSAGPAVPSDSHVEPSDGHAEPAPAEALAEAIAAQVDAERVVAPGDTLSELVSQVYGFSNPKLVDWVKDSNPAMESVNRILVGETVVFPALGLRGSGAAPARASREPGETGESS